MRNAPADSSACDDSADEGNYDQYRNRQNCGSTDTSYVAQLIKMETC